MRDNFNSPYTVLNSSTKELFDTFMNLTCDANNFSHYDINELTPHLRIYICTKTLLFHLESKVVIFVIGILFPNDSLIGIRWFHFADIKSMGH